MKNRSDFNLEKCNIHQNCIIFPFYVLRDTIQKVVKRISHKNRRLKNKKRDFSFKEMIY